VNNTQAPSYKIVKYLNKRLNNWTVAHLFLSLSWIRCHPIRCIFINSKVCLLVSSCLSHCLSTAPTGYILMKFDIEDLWKPVIKHHK
jgi:hypothetical protein